MRGSRSESEESEALCADDGDEGVAVGALGLDGSLDVGSLRVDSHWGLGGSWLWGVELGSNMRLRGEDEESAVGSVGEHFE